MTGWEIGAAVYLAFGLVMVLMMIPGASDRVQAVPGSAGWWFGGMMAGLVVTVAWLPIVAWALVFGDDPDDA